MAVIRGSTHSLNVIKEATFGTTPATPTLKAVPFTNFSMKASHSLLRSAQIRAHPFTDRLLNGRKMHELTCEWELQPANHDILFETVFGAAIATKALTYTDALKGLSIESRTNGATAPFNQFTGSYFNQIDVSCSANDTAPIKCTASGMALVGVLDAGATIATAITAASDVDPLIFADGSLTLTGDVVDVVTGNFSIQRAVDPLMIWGSRVPREFIPGAVTATGTITVPYDDDVYSAKWDGFSNESLLFNFADEAGTVFRKFTFPKTKFVSLGRQINTRAGIMQEINWEAIYDLGSTTFAKMETE